jgi:hypothetical protein
MREITDSGKPNPRATLVGVWDSVRRVIDELTTPGETVSSGQQDARAARRRRRFMSGS